MGIADVKHIFKKKLSYFIIGIFFTILIAYGLFTRYQVNQNGIVVNAYAFEQKGYQMGRYTPSWNYVYVYKGRKYFAAITRENTRYGNSLRLKINRNDPGKHISLDPPAYNDVDNIVFFGYDFNFKEKLEIYSKGRLIKSITIDDEFGIKLPLKRSYVLKLYRNNELYSVYQFTFPNSGYDLNFPIQIESPTKKVTKVIKFDVHGEFTVESKDNVLK